MSVPSDHQERTRALDPAASFIVQAPAGSGKTELLIQRFLGLLAVVRAPEEILALTFTRRAAGEMRDRIWEALDKAARGVAAGSAHERETSLLASRALERSRSLGWDLEGNPARLRVHTIDSFMAWLVARMPWLSRLGGQPAIASRAEDLYEEAARCVLDHLDADDLYAESLAAVLDHLDNHAAELKSLLVELLGKRDQWIRLRPRLEPETMRPRLEQGLHRTVQRTLEEAARAFAPRGVELGVLAGYAGANVAVDHPLAMLAGREWLPAADPEQLAAWQALARLLLTSGHEWRKPGGVNKSLGFPSTKGGDGGHRQRMQELLAVLGEDTVALAALQAVARLPRPEYGHEQWQTVAAIVRMMDLAVVSLREVMARRCEVDFAEVALSALRALGDAEAPSDLLLALDRTLCHLLVDEYQDTSHLQTLLLERLTEGWTPGDGRTLFLVGDPMQSIYRFREAEVGLFLNAWQGRLGGVPLTPLRLEANFRSQEGVVGWVNRSFEAVFPREGDHLGGAVPFAPSVATRPALAGAAVEVRAAAAFDSQAEATQVADEVAAALVHGDVAILVRSRSHLAQILRELERREIRYAGQDLDPLGERPVVRDLESLTRALLNPADRLSWLAVLRAPWCGLLLTDLLALVADSDQPIPALLSDEARVQTLSNDSRSRLARVWPILAAALGESRRRPLRIWIEGAWTALGAPAYLEPQEMLDAATFLGLLEQLDAGGEIRPLHLLRDHLDNLHAAPDPAAGSGLQVLTIHKAKGLQFDTVLLPGLGRPTRGDSRRLLHWSETVDGDLLVAPLPPRVAGARDPIVDFVRALERGRDLHETNRLLYVAVTRARKRVVLWGHAEATRKGTVQPKKGSLLASLWPAVASQYEGLAQSVPTDPEPRPQIEDSSLVRLPSGWRPPTPRTTVAIVGTPAARTGEVFAGPEFHWVGETARAVGTVAHRLLKRVAEEGVERWAGPTIETRRGWVRAQLQGLGTPPGDLEGAAERVLEVLRRTLDDPKGRWILDSREDAASELELTRSSGHAYESRAVDRTFVAEGQRWIIDFKTSTHEGGDAEAFLAAEVDRYREQLQTYAQLLRLRDPDRPVRAGLYYPLLGAWREVRLDP